MKIEELILKVVSNKKGIAITQICRTINERGLSYCVLKNCYANKRKQEKYFVAKPVCKFSRSLIFNKINKMESEKEPRLKTKKEKKTDTRQPRGWDWMRGVYIPSDFPEEEFEQCTFDTE